MVLFEVLGQHNPALREGTLLCVRFQRVEDQEIAEMPVTPIKIRTLQRKLYAKAKQAAILIMVADRMLRKLSLPFLAPIRHKNRYCGSFPLRVWLVSTTVRA